MNDREELMRVARHSAVDLIQTDGTTLSTSAIRTRMIRIGKDLIQAAKP